MDTTRPVSGTSGRRYVRTLDLLSFIGGIVLLVALSEEIIEVGGIRFSRGFLTIQFVVCLVFLLDFFARWASAGHKGRYILRNILILLLSIPYLTLLAPFELPRDVALLVGIVPFARLFLALFLIVRWLVENRTGRLFAAYVLTVVLFTYISALVFYDCEVPVNRQLDGFGDALWWACMNVTTVGAALLPVTTAGKVLCVLLPVLGMMLFPVFTAYILSVYRAPVKKE